MDVLLLDPEFESMEKELPNVFCNFAGAREHVPVIERKIRTVEERGRGIINVLPFGTVPSRIIIELIHHVILWLNCVPSKVGISTIHSPREIMTGTTLDFKKHCVLPFGAYVEVHDKPTPPNGQKSRTIPAINLGPTGNLQGSHKFLSLLSRKMLKKRSWTAFKVCYCLFPLFGTSTLNVHNLVKN